MRSDREKSYPHQARKAHIGLECDLRSREYNVGAVSLHPHCINEAKSCKYCCMSVQKVHRASRVQISTSAICRTSAVCPQEDSILQRVAAGSHWQRVRGWAGGGGGGGGYSYGEAVSGTATNPTRASAKTSHHISPHVACINLTNAHNCETVVIEVECKSKVTISAQVSVLRCWKACPRAVYSRPSSSSGGASAFI